MEDGEGGTTKDVARNGRKQVSADTAHRDRLRALCNIPRYSAVAPGHRRCLPSLTVLTRSRAPNRQDLLLALRTLATTLPCPSLAFFRCVAVQPSLDPIGGAEKAGFGAHGLTFKLHKGSLTIERIPEVSGDFGNLALPLGLLPSTLL